MSNNIPFKNQSSYTPNDSSFFNEPRQILQTPSININLAPTASQIFNRVNTPMSPPAQTPQIQNTSLYQSNNLGLHNSMMYSPYMQNQTPAMQGPIQSPNDGRSPMMNLVGEGRSPQANITIYNYNNNKLSLINKNSSSSSYNLGENQNFNKNSDIEPKLQNIVSTANLGCELRLRQIALQARNAEYNPKRFAAVIMRIKEPKTTALIFSSGKMVCTGAKSEDESKKASRKYAKIIKSLGFPVEFKDFKVQNIVGSCDIKFQIHLNKLNGILGKINTKESKNKGGKYICQYEPEIFPGLIYHMSKPEIVLLIFVSGKIVLTGAKQRNEIFTAFNNIYPVLKKCKNENRDNKSNKSLHKQEVEEKKALTQTKDETKENE